MNTITSDLVTETETFRFTTEASTLRWFRMPPQAPTSLGNGLPFLRKHIEFGIDGVLWADYSQDCGCIHLRVFNA